MAGVGHRARCARLEAVVMSRLVAVSNRVGSLRGTTRAGGLAVALAEALQTRHGLWFGWSGEVTENTEAQVKQQTTAGVTRATVSLTRAEHHERSEESRVGKEGGRTCRSRWSP